MKKYIFGNWKMYLNTQQSIDLARTLAEKIEARGDVSLAVFPNTLAFYGVAAELQKSPIATGAQNVAWTPQGAYTGATSAFMFKDAGATYALVGHSESRHIFGETNEEVRKKLEACIDEGLVPVLCIGETQEDRDAGKTQYRLKKQLMKALEGLSLNGSGLIIAYEPVWAISKSGVGEPCLPPDAEDVQGWIKGEIKNYLSQEIPVIYGGSVKADNVADYMHQKSVDGVLVGNASTKADSFISLIQNIN